MSLKIFLYNKIILIYFILYFCQASVLEEPKLGWIFGQNDYFINMSTIELKKFLGLKKIRMTSRTILDSPFLDKEIPGTFDARIQWSNCSKIINTVRDQSACGSCWAAASTATMSDLTCIQCNGEFSPYISDEDVLSCCHQCGDCQAGGQVDVAFEYWINTGIVTGGLYGSNTGCRPYSIPPQSQLHGKVPSTPKCQQVCQAHYEGTYQEDLRKGSKYNPVSGVRSMQLQILVNGPIVAQFKIYESFMKNYQGGVYQHPAGDNEMGWHAAKVIGWGIENGQKYWLAVNSWGTNWGDKGFFKILRGTNECEFEEIAFGGVASPSSCFSQLNSTAVNDSQSIKKNGSRSFWAIAIFILYYFSIESVLRKL